MSEPALALEARSPQGRSLRLRFDRSYFHRRAENFREWKLITAWRDEALIGIAGAALKRATFNEQEVTAGFFFDLRVAPEERRTRLAKQLINAFEEWVTGKVDLTYGYVVGDNEAAQKLAAKIFGNVVTPAFRCLVYPIIGKSSRPAGFSERDGAEVHRHYLRSAGPFDLYCSPEELFGSSAYAGSWLFEGERGRAGASAWSNKGILAEVVDRLPTALAAVGALLRLPLFRLLPLPRVPRPGEAISSWYIFDLYADGTEEARALIRGISAEARSAGVEYLYLLHHGGEPWLETLRADVPRLFAPIIPYCLVGGAGDKITPVHIRRPYVDVRDV